MVARPRPFTRLVSEISKLPGIGPKSASRLAFHILSRPRATSDALVGALSEALAAVGPCRTCHGIAEGEACEFCSDPGRDRALICVVEDPGDVYAVEESGVYHGVYFVLGGALSPIEGRGPDDLRIGELRARVAKESPREVILAFGADTEGEATAQWVARELAGPGRTVKRLGSGLSYGSRVEYADPVTLARAMESRRPA